MNLVVVSAVPVIFIRVHCPCVIVLLFRLEIFFLGVKSGSLKSSLLPPRLDEFKLTA